MKTESDEPIHLFGGMVNGVESRQPRDLRGKPVARVDAEVADDQREYRLDPYRPRLDPESELRRGGSSHDIDGAEGDHQRAVEKRTVHEAGHRVHRPAASEDGLFRVRRCEPLEWNEDGGGDDQ